MKETWVLQGTHTDFGQMLLVSPGDDPKRYRTGERRGRCWATNLGLIGIASYLEHDGWDFRQAYQLDDDNALTSLCRQSWVGISVLPSNYQPGLEIGKQAAEAGAKKIILGGPYATTRATQIIVNQQFVDYVVVGAGEMPLQKIVSGILPSEIPGIAYRNLDKKIRLAPPTYFPLSDRPVPNRYLWPVAEEERAGQRGTVAYWQDGCPYAKKCIFCTIQHFGFSRRSVKQIVAEMRQLRDLKYSAIEEGGDDFASDLEEKWLDNLIQHVENEALHFAWLIHASTRSLLRFPSMLNALVKIGVKIIQVGFESGADNLKYRFKTSSKNEKLLAEQCQLIGLRIYGGWVLGMPGETQESLLMTRDQILSLYHQGILVGICFDPLWPGPGSTAFELLCKTHPAWGELDFVAPEDLIHAWVSEHTKISLGDVLKFREEILKQLNGLQIVGGMLL